MPLWKWSHAPSGGSHENPVQPNGCVTAPAIGHSSVPLKADSIRPPPQLACDRASAIARAWAAFCAATCLRIISAMSAWSFVCALTDRSIAFFAAALFLASFA